MNIPSKLQTPAEAACRRRTSCRLCGGKNLELAFALTPTPPANAFVPASAAASPQKAYPLDLFFCKDCTHLQLLDVVDPSALFEDYVYVSGTSPVFVRHFKDYAEDVIRRYGLKPGDFVLDVGSNDGTLLRFFKEAGMEILGVDPAREIAGAASAAGIETLPEFFTSHLAKDILSERGSAAAVTANNVFAHADDLKDFVAGVRAILRPDGVFVFEVSYLADVVAKTLFDTIYHEHLAYHAARPLERFFAANGMELIAALPSPSHGGSLRGVAQVRGGPRRADPSLAEALKREAELGLDRLETYRAFAKNVDGLKEKLSALVRGLRAEGKRIAGFGAPAKMTTLMHHFGLGPDVVDFIVDDSPLKQGLFSPGHHIPVVPSSAIYERKPDYLLLLAWNFAEPIMAKHKAYAEAGGRFIIPLPEIKVV